MCIFFGQTPAWPVEHIGQTPAWPVEHIGRIAGDQWERLLENPDLDAVTIR